jgi:hypothetical protein
MNTMSCIAGSLEAVLTGYILHWTNGGWQVALYSFVAAYFAGLLCWIPLSSILASPVPQIELS